MNKIRKPGDIFNFNYHLWTDRDPRYQKPNYPHPHVASNHKIFVYVRKVYLKKDDIYYLCSRYNEKFNTLHGSEFIVKQSELEE